MSTLNLSQNFRARSYTHDRQAFVGDNFQKAAYDSCSSVTNSVGDNNYEMTYTFPEPVTFHSVLMVLEPIAEDIIVYDFKVFIYSLDGTLQGICSFDSNDRVGGEAWCNAIG